MAVPRRLALLSVLALAGCVSTHDEPFPLDDGVAVSAAAGNYLCDAYDVAGKTVEESRRARLIQLRQNKKTQYVFADGSTLSAKPFTLHKAGANLYIVAAAHADAPGEDLYVAEFADATKAFKLYSEGDDFDAQAQGIARAHAVALAHSEFSNDLGGPVNRQRDFMIAMASDLKSWKTTADCRAAP